MGSHNRASALLPLTRPQVPTKSPGNAISRAPREATSRGCCPNISIKALLWPCVTCPWGRLPLGHCHLPRPAPWLGHGLSVVSPPSRGQCGLLLGPPDLLSTLCHSSWNCFLVRGSPWNRSLSARRSVAPVRRRLQHMWAHAYQPQNSWPQSRWLPGCHFVASHSHFGQRKLPACFSPQLLE